MTAQAHAVRVGATGTRRAEGLKRWELAGCMVAATTTALFCTAAAAARSPGTGCHPARPAIAHHPRAKHIRPQPRRAPVPCLTAAGITTDSAPVAVTPRGTVLFAPISTVMPGQVPAPGDTAFPTAVARTIDRGAHWRTVLPVDDPNDTAHQHIGLIPWLYADHTTGRIWYATPAGGPTICGAMISYSDDEGLTWTDDDQVGCPGQGGMSVFEGPAPRHSAKPVGYPHVVYYCANLQDNGPHLVYCYRSLDGGKSFAQVGGFPNGSPPPSCQDTLDAPRGRAVGPSGTVYMIVDRCDEGVALSTSHDEGDSWTQTPVSRTVVESLPVTSLAVDRHETLYAAWTDAADHLPYVTYSRDRGRTWGRPAMVAAPGVNRIDARTLAIAVDRPGHAAIAYSGSTNGGRTYNGYLAESSDALARKPIWWSASVNDPAHPLERGAPSTLYGDREWFSTVEFGADGTPWAGFHCVRTERCPGNRVGMVGRLAAPAGRSRSRTRGCGRTPRCGRRRA